MQTTNASHAARDAHGWVVVLAGGQGRRMRHLTLTPEGVAVPKQYCGIGKGPSLLHLALARAAAVAPPERIIVTVTREHRRWWKSLADLLPWANILVEPVQRGTGIGILQAVMEIARRDPRAVITILPSDHFFASEAAIATALTAATRLARTHPRDVLLLGFVPEGHDPDLGYIVPLPACADEPRQVQRFVEKPGAGHVASLVDAGALVNSFITVASARALLSLFERRQPRAVRRLRQWAATASQERPAFRDLPNVDFSRDILGADGARLRVMRVGACGWSDLGTPARLERVLRRYGDRIAGAPLAPVNRRGRVDLGERVAAIDSANVAA